MPLLFVADWFGLLELVLGAVAVTQGPGLVGSLLVGVSFAKALAWSRGIPVVPVHHLAGHIESLTLAHGELPMPAAILVVSGGHTSLYLVAEPGRYQLIGRTRDDAAGEAYDKVAKMMGLGYPGGRVIDQLSKSGNPKAIRFPRARMKKGAHEFSFSGLKTAVWHYLREQGATPPAEVAASFQEAVVDMLVAPTVRAAVELDVKRVVLAGGVAANSRLRQKMTEAAASEGLELHVPPPALCTDNGAMIALAGYHMLRRGLRDDLYLNADADLTL